MLVSYVNPFKLGNLPQKTKQKQKNRMRHVFKFAAKKKMNKSILKEN